MSAAPGGSDGRAGARQARIRLSELWLAICRKLHGPHPTTAQALADLAAAHGRLGHFDTALAHLEEALAMLSALRGAEHADLLPILNRIDRVCLHLGRFQDAWTYSERALTIAERAFGSDSVELAKPLAALAEAFFALGFLDRCYAAVTRALVIARAAFGGDDPETAEAKVRLGVLLAEMGDLAQAITLHEQALAVMRAHDRKEWIAAILVSLGGAHLAARDNAAARPFYEEALATARAHFGNSHATTGAYLAVFANYLGQVGEDRRALAVYDEALAIMRAAHGETHPEVATALLDKGSVRYRAESAAGRTDVFRAVAILGTREHRPRLFAQGLLLLARMLAPSSAAILFQKLAINEIETMREQVARLDPILERTFLRRNEDEFRALGDELIGRGRLPEAQQVLAMIKETTVSLTTLETQWVERGEALLADIKASLDGCRARDPDERAALLWARIDAAAGQLASWFDQLVAAFAAAEGASEQMRATVASPLPPSGTALLQYLFAPDHSSTSIILTTRDLQREHRIAHAAGELNRLVYAMRDAVQTRSADFLDVAQRLYRLLIAPVAADLHSRNIATLALSLDGTLRYLPVAALHDGERYLIEQFALVLATGAVVAPPAGTTARRAVGLRAVGLGVSRPVAGCPPLPGVREELASVVRVDAQGGGVFPGVIRLDEAFTAAALQDATSQPNSVLHIASQFIFEAAQEASSYLLLGDGSRLTLSELAALRFRDVELVALSACNTAVGGGHRQNGREIEGLGALVRHQGGRSVLATLWPVADRATATLMRDFYRNWHETGLAPPEALRRAQLDVLHAGRTSVPQTTSRGLVDPDEEPGDRGLGISHPFYWAPYILMGEATG